ncbi:hypothetical protein B0H15DRAFT_838953 [Mycena belliarum]|uniref:RanBP2-type domain-containing protein n=1 Tax=Mycena belliarum TaxID=1033014 RepID=A0AAD6U3U5_9AGAR|nr:hypothetical protein B0H15DRAFT_838953 [Mycena belliae]
MSGVVRSRPRRSVARSAAASPYARPRQVPAKKSPWSIATGLLSFLNPLRLRFDSRSLSPIQVDDDEDDGDEDDAEDDSPPESLSARGRQLAPEITVPQQQQPTMDAIEYLLPDSSSPQKNLETVVSFLDQRRGQTISPLEAEGLISLIHKSTPSEPEKPEPFRFSTSASLPSTPARGNSPATPTTAFFTVGASASTSTLTNSGSPRKTLSKNPNGVYRWSGGGSARPTKNRYASPAFGSPTRASSEHLVFKDSPVQNDASPKRRRVDKTPESTPPPIPRSTAPDPSPTRIAASKYFPFPVSTPTSSPASSPATAAATTPAPALAVTPARAALNLVKSLPVHPSPLRQAWGGSPASSVSSTGSSPAHGPGTPTKAATLLTAVIRDLDAEMPKRPAAVRNPYQSASPVGVRVTNTHPAGRKRARATGKPPAAEALQVKEQEEKEEKKRKMNDVVVSPQAIIEATLPKGSKRSRPPPNFSASVNNLAAPPALSPRRSPRLEPQHINADEEQEKEKDVEEREAGAPAAKRAKFPTSESAPVINGKTNGLTNGFVNGKNEGTVPTTPPAYTSTPSASAPSVSNGSASNPSSGLGLTLGSGAATGFEFRLPKAGPKPLATAPKEPSKLRYSFQPPPTPPPVADKERRVFPMAPPPVPAPKSSISGPSAPSSIFGRAADPKDAARAVPVTALPSFVFAVLTNSSDGSADKAVREAARRLEKSALPTFDFSASVQDNGKARVSAQETRPAVQGFNWAAAGVKPPKPAAPGAWTCETCTLANPADAKDKCTVCDAKRPGAEPAPVVQGFNWAMAGAKPPQVQVAGAWTCGTCMLPNGPEVKDKCSVCDTPR